MVGSDRVAPGGSHSIPVGVQYTYLSALICYADKAVNPMLTTATRRRHSLSVLSWSMLCCLDVTGKSDWKGVLGWGGYNWHEEYVSP